MAGDFIGRVFNDRYKITERIGIGGMAEVYRAQDSVLGRTVAVKVMLPQYAESPDFTQRFKQEAAAAANLQSPYIVNIYDWGNDAGTYYIVMELIRGTDLKSGIKARGALNQRKVAEIGSQVCSALAVAHKQDLIHRDIKPQNIMVQPDGNIKVMDFGIAHAKNSLKDQTSSVLGTAHYISPEQAQGKELGAASDIYSLGIVLFEAATGKLPFDGPDAISVAMKQVNELPPYPSQFNPNIDPVLENIIMKALEKNPHNRFSSAVEMRAALNDFLAGRTPNIAGGVSSSAKTAYLGNGVNAGHAGATVVMGAGAVGAAQNGAYGQRNPMDKTAVLPASENAVMGVDASSSAARSYRQNNAMEDDSKKTVSRRAVIGGVIAVAVVAVLAIAAFNIFGSAGSSNAEQVEVPNLVGMTAREATAALKEVGLELGTTDKSYDANAEDGEVIKQTPEAKTKAAKGSKVNITVSLGAEQVVVPDLSNLTAKEAQDVLTKLGLTAHAGTAEYSSEIEVNHIISQSPAVGETVTKGDSVEYVLSLGAENVTVPNVVGYAQSGAESAITSAGFKVAVETQYSSSVSEGLVISQSPNGGKLEKGETVTIVVSDGPDPATAEIDIPNVVGETVSKAKSELENAGFSVTVNGKESDTAKVTAQSPTGTAVKGTTITITVG